MGGSSSNEVFYIKSKEARARLSRGARVCDPRTYESSWFNILNQEDSLY